MLVASKSSSRIHPANLHTSTKALGLLEQEKKKQWRRSCPSLPVRTTIKTCIFFLYFPHRYDFGRRLAHGTTRTPLRSSPACSLPASALFSATRPAAAKDWSRGRNGTMRATSHSRGGATSRRLVGEARRELTINLKRSPARRKDAAHRRTGSAWRRTGPTHGEIMGDVQARLLGTPSRWRTGAARPPANRRGPVLDVEPGEAQSRPRRSARRISADRHSACRADRHSAYRCGAVAHGDVRAWLSGAPSRCWTGYMLVCPADRFSSCPADRFSLARRTGLARSDAISRRQTQLSSTCSSTTAHRCNSTCPLIQARLDVHHRRSSACGVRRAASGVQVQLNMDVRRRRLTYRFRDKSWLGRVVGVRPRPARSSTGRATAARYK
jgi:hypothetical protein